MINKTLAEMLWTLTDCALEQLKNGRELKKVIVYGFFDLPMHQDISYYNNNSV